jgi:hypothetical protein
MQKKINDMDSFMLLLQQIGINDYCRAFYRHALHVLWFSLMLCTMRVSNLDYFFYHQDHDIRYYYHHHHGATVMQSV